MQVEMKMVTRRMELEQEVKALKRKLDEQKEEFDSEVNVLKKKLDEKQEDQEVKGLKRKLDEQKEEFDSEVIVLKKKLDEKEGDQEVKELKRKLDEQKEQFETERKVLKEQLDEKDKSKNNKQDHILMLLKDKLECPVCLDIPRSCPVPVCPNGHVVCQTCKRDSCPTCRTAMGNGMSLLAGTVLENIDHKCKFEDCIENFALLDLEKHEVVCPHRTVNCPDSKCAVKTPLAKLVQHLRNSQQCCGQDVKESFGYWNRRNFNMKDISVKDTAWPMHIYSYSGVIFAVYPIKSGGQIYFVLVMFASEAECSKYEFEMIVHERGSWALDSVMSVKFCGNPLSIDLKKEDLKLFGTMERLMTKIVKKSINENSFSLSFKISKKKNM